MQDLFAHWITNVNKKLVEEQKSTYLPYKIHNSSLRQEQFIRSWDEDDKRIISLDPENHAGMEKSENPTLPVVF